MSLIIYAAEITGQLARPISLVSYLSSPLVVRRWSGEELHRNEVSGITQVFQIAGIEQNIQ